MIFLSIFICACVVVAVVCLAYEAGVASRDERARAYEDVIKGTSWADGYSKGYKFAMDKIKEKCEEIL